MQISKHGQKRIQQRGLSTDIIDIIMVSGRETHAAGGVVKLLFGNKEYQQTISKLKKRMKLLARAKNGIIVVGSNGKVITAYKAY